MTKKIFSILILLFIGQVVLSEEIPVNVKPANKVTTSNVNLQEGDNINFVVKDNVIVNSKLIIKKGEPVSGTITHIENNDYLYKPASLYADNFITKDVDGKTVKLRGIIYKKGNDHWTVTQFIPLPLVWLRGGEVQIKPNKDIFTLIFEE